MIQKETQKPPHLLYVLCRKRLLFGKGNAAEEEEEEEEEGSSSSVVFVDVCFFGGGETKSFERD